MITFLVSREQRFSCYYKTHFIFNCLRIGKRKVRVYSVINGITSFYQFVNQSCVATKSVQIQIGSQPEFLRENESKDIKWINQKLQLKRTERPCFYLHAIVCFPIHQTRNSILESLDSLFVYSSINGLKCFFDLAFLRYRHDQWTEWQKYFGSKRNCREL